MAKKYMVFDRGASPSFIKSIELIIFNALCNNHCV